MPGAFSCPLSPRSVLWQPTFPDRPALPAPGFDVHLGYEADLLTALEAIPGAGLAFSRSGIAQWDGIWLRAADDRYDVVGGGITILDSRVFDGLRPAPAPWSP